MNKITESQLKKCVYADLTHKKDNTYFIPKYTKPQYCIGKCYLVKLPREIINNYNNVLATNWNNGTAPQYEYYKAYVSKTVARMIYVDCRAFDFENKVDLSAMWSGYLDTDTLTQIEEVR